MSSVDPKPTYTLRVESILLSLALASRRKKVRDRILEFANLGLKKIEELDIRDAAYAHKLADDVDDANFNEESIGLGFELAAAREDMIRNGPDNDGLQAITEAFTEWARDTDETHLASRAAFAVSSDIVLAGDYSGVRHDNEWAVSARLASAVGRAGAYTLKMHPMSVDAVHDNMHRALMSATPREAMEREVAEDISYHTVSRRVRSAYAFALSKRNFKAKAKIYPDGVTVESVLKNVSGKIRRDSEFVYDIDYFYLGPIRAIKRDRVLYIMDQDNIRKVYHLFHRRFMAIASAVCATVTTPNLYDPKTVKVVTASLIRASGAVAKSGGKVSNIPRAMHQAWCAEFAAAYDPEGEAYWKPHYEEIMKSAVECSPVVNSWMSAMAHESPANRLELLRLHHILPAADTPADLMRDLTFAIPEGARKPDHDFFTAWMKFVKSYELCMYLYRKKSWPNVKGDELQMANPAYARCLRGKFQLPLQEDFGKLWIFNHFPYIHHADQLPLKAKDATRLPYDKEAAVSQQRIYEHYEHNELLHALKKGATMGAPMNWSIDRARKEFWDPENKMHVLADVAAKAEVSKSDIKPRCTFSANGEFRHMQAEFDRNIQAINDVIGCGSLRADPAGHARGLSHVAMGTRLGRMTSSHDISGWSTSQDRSYYIEFGKYRAGLFKGLNPDGWASKWQCFDTVISKPGLHAHMHQTNGGYQGYPPTMDTGMHVLILTYFLHRMREQRLIPPKSITLAKATIDDCLAQIGDWMGSEKQLEVELYNHYIKLGYEVDSIKSVISKSKSIYLNQSFIRGASVHQGLKVMLKVDRPLEVILGTPFEDYMSATAGAKAAIAVGHEPLSAYYLASVLGCRYLIAACNDIQKMDSDSFAAAAIIGRLDGGLGLSLLPDLVCKEHPDNRSHYNHVLFMWARCRRMSGKAVSPKCLKMIAALKTAPWRVVSKPNIFFNPRQAVRATAVSLESVRRNIIVTNARSWCTAEPYRSVLRTAKNEALNGIYSHFLASSKDGIDAAFLEAFSSHLPETIIDSLVGKVTSYSVAAELCGPQEIILGQIRMSRLFKSLVSGLLSAHNDTSLSAADIWLDLCETPGYVRAKSEREEFYATNLVHITSHTVPSPFEVISVVSTEADVEQSAHIGSDYGSLLNWVGTDSFTSRTTISKHGLAWPFKSQGWVADNNDIFRVMDPVTNKFVEGCAILEWARNAELDVRAWEALFMMRWIGDMSRESSEFVTKSLQGSIKRSTSVFGDQYHPVFAHPNLQRSVMVNVTPLLSLLSSGQYDIDPMSIIATSYAIGVCNLSFIQDQLALAGHASAPWAWQVGINPNLYEEQRHLAIEVGVTTSTLQNMYELELEGTEYICNDEGTAKQLKLLISDLGLSALYTAAETSHDGGILSDQPTLAPMVSAPSAAPLGATFLLSQGPRRVAGTLAIDKLEGHSSKRLLEVSPQSAKLCFVAALQDYSQKAPLINQRLLGDPDAFPDSQLADLLEECSLTAVAIIKANIPTAQPLYQAAKALRACGLTKFRWDDTTSTDASAFAAAVRQTAHTTPSEAMNVLHTYLSGVLLSTGKSYHEKPQFIRQSKNPDKSNAAERVNSIRRKFRSRAKEYQQRIAALKGGHSTVDTGNRARVPQRKLVYLTAAKTMMECAEFSDGPVPDMNITSQRLLGRINEKLRKHGHDPVIELGMELMVDGKITREQLCIANSGPSGSWWIPDEYARGVLAAQDWLFEDCEVESRLVYFAPRSVQVVQRVRKHTVMRDNQVTPVDFYQVTQPAAVPQPIVEEQAEEVPKPAPVVKKERGPAGGFMKSLFASKRPARKTKGEYVEFCRSIEAWQMVSICLSNGEDPEIEGDSRDQIRVSIQGSVVKKADLSEVAVESLIESTAGIMERVQAKMIAPEESEDGPGDDLVM